MRSFALSKRLRGRRGQFLASHIAFSRLTAWHRWCGCTLQSLRQLVSQIQMRQCGPSLIATVNFIRKQLETRLSLHTAARVCPYTASVNLDCQLAQQAWCHFWGSWLSCGKAHLEVQLCMQRHARSEVSSSLLNESSTCDKNQHSIIKTEAGETSLTRFKLCLTAEERAYG